jgi:hypothetical protein
LQFQDSKVFIDNSDNAALWSELYSVIYQSNAMITGLDKSTAIPKAECEQLQSEAKFLRAFAYFYLVNLYDHIPLILTTNVNENRIARQPALEQVYDQIVKDLLEAKARLGVEYTGSGKVRANKWAASALLARVYLYQERWAEAEKEASGVINSGLYMPLPKLEETFLADSREAILQFWVINGFTADAAQIITSSASLLPTYLVAKQLYDTFESADERKTEWISKNEVTTSGTTRPYYYPAKYKNREANPLKPEYIMALRLSEQYLIRAEALAQQNNVAEAIADLNIVRNRAGLLPLIVDMSKSACLNTIAKERQLELFGEWGHRFFDLKRTNDLNVVMQPLKPMWRTEAKSFPIPSSEITYNPNLIQNHGY